MCAGGLRSLCLAGCSSCVITGPLPDALQLLLKHLEVRTGSDPSLLSGSFQEEYSEWEGRAARFAGRHPHSRAFATFSLRLLFGVSPPSSTSLHFLKLCDCRRQTSAPDLSLTGEPWPGFCAHLPQVPGIPKSPRCPCSDVLLFSCAFPQLLAGA